MRFAPADFLQKSDPENFDFLARCLEEQRRSEAVAGPVLIWVLIGQVGWLLGWLSGWLWGGIAVFAVLSMFRTHMIYIAQRVMGQRPEIPK